MNDRVLFAYSGSLASSAAVAWLRERHGAEVVTVTLDVGQSEDLDEVRGRALTCGATRAHVIDARDTFARDYVIPALAESARAAGPTRLRELAHPLIARTLVEIGAIESADAVAHASFAETSTLDEHVAALDPTVRVLAPAREWTMDASALMEYARARNLPASVSRNEQHLLIRQALDPSRALQTDAHIEIAFDRGVPVAINGVPLTLQELIESLSLIGGQHGVGHADAVPPAAVLLEAAYRAARGSDGPVRLTLRDGTYAVDMGSEVISIDHPVNTAVTPRSVLEK